MYISQTYAQEQDTKYIYSRAVLISIILLLSELFNKYIIFVEKFTLYLPMDVTKKNYYYRVTFIRPI